MKFRQKYFGEKSIKIEILTSLIYPYQWLKERFQVTVISVA